MITLESDTGIHIARRLLSIGFSPNGGHNNESDIPMASSTVDDEKLHQRRGEWMDGYDKDPYYNEDGDTETPRATAIMTRRLLQQPQMISSSALSGEPSMVQTSNSLVVSLNIPEKTAVTQLCPIIGASAENCRGVQYTTLVSDEKADQLCAAEEQGTLNAMLDTGMRSALMSDATFDSNVSSVLLMDYSVSGCSNVVGPHRALRQTTSGRLVVVITNLLLTVDNGNSVVLTQRAQEYVDFFRNATIMQQLLGGSAVLISALEGPPVLQFTKIVNSTYFYDFYQNMTLIWDNVTVNNKTLWLVNGGNKNLTAYLNRLHPAVDGIQNNDMFIYDRVVAPGPSEAQNPSASSASTAVVAITNTLTLSMAVFLACCF
jgi:hypothetical protein